MTELGLELGIYLWALAAGAGLAVLVAASELAYTEGLLVQLANPKAGVFMFSFSPQFIPARHDVLTWTAGLAGIQVLVETALSLGLAAGVGRASAWFRRSAIRRRLDAVAGTVLIGLGIRVAATAR